MSNTLQLRQPAAWKLPAQLLVPLLIAIFIELVVRPRIAETAGYKNLVEHLTIALMIASILGLTYEFFLNNARVALSDGSTFGSGGAGFLRLNFACPRATLEDALDRMRRACVRG